MLRHGPRRRQSSPESSAEYRPIRRLSCTGRARDRGLSSVLAGRIAARGGRCGFLGSICGLDSCNLRALGGHFGSRVNAARGPWGVSVVAILTRRLYNRDEVRPTNEREAATDCRRSATLHAAAQKEVVLAARINRALRLLGAQTLRATRNTRGGNNTR